MLESFCKKFPNIEPKHSATIIMLLIPLKMKIFIIFSDYDMVDT